MTFLFQGSNLNMSNHGPSQGTHLVYGHWISHEIIRVILASRVILGGSFKTKKIVGRGSSFCEEHSFFLSSDASRLCGEAARDTKPC